MLKPRIAVKYCCATIPPQPPTAPSLRLDELRLQPISPETAPQSSFVSASCAVHDLLLQSPPSALRSVRSTMVARMLQRGNPEGLRLISIGIFAVFALAERSRPCHGPCLRVGDEAGDVVRVALSARRYQHLDGPADHLLS